MMNTIFRIVSAQLTLLFFIFLFLAGGCANAPDTAAPAPSPVAPSTAAPSSAAPNPAAEEALPATVAAADTAPVFDLDHPLQFYSLPFPIDLRRRANGAVPYYLFPNPRLAPLLARFLWVASFGNDGFGANAGLLFTFTGDLDPQTLPADPTATLKKQATIFLVGLDPSSPDYGKRYPFRWKFTPEETVYAPAHLLVLAPVEGVMMLHGRRYAAVITTGVSDALGRPLQPAAEFQAALAGASPDHRANELFAPLAAWLNENGIPHEQVAVATVFTTQSPLRRMLALRDHAASLELPAIDPATVSQPEPRGIYSFLEGRMRLPIYQFGRAPHVLLGGGIAWNAGGKPQVQRFEEVRFGLTIPHEPIPANGWPLVIYSHGSGGDYRSFEQEGLASWMARVGIAMLSLDAPHHGPRNPLNKSDAWECYCFYNHLNPRALRDNALQAAVELFIAKRQILKLRLPAPSGQGAAASWFFDPANVFFMGHSQGSTVGPLLVAVDPDLRAAVFSGAGAGLIQNLLTKTKPFSSWPFVRLGLSLSSGEAARELDEFNPALILLQHAAEAADTISFNPYFFDQPVPGSRPKHILQIQSEADSYVGIPCHGTFGAAAKLDLLGPILVQDNLEKMMLAGGRLLPGSTARGNRTAYDGSPITAVAVQLPKPAYTDGHFAMFYASLSEQLISEFFRTAIDQAVPTLTDYSSTLAKAPGAL